MNPSFLTRSRTLLALAIAAGLALCLLGGLSAQELLCLAPAPALAMLLLWHRYPGERLLSNLIRARRDNGRARQPKTSLPVPRAGQARVPRGGLLMGFALAVRPPPALRTAS